ncbi:capsular biosynthesis protein CpsH, partial [Bacillus mobilis]|nr:capsular biosynthesis protein CpsH [Bacillus mobilis]MCU5737544.1 capsular biosynthesis protein CpsH [Bacillus mobilis]
MFLVKVILLVLWIIFVVILEKVVRKKLNIPKQIDWNSKYVNNSHKWGTR